MKQVYIFLQIVLNSREAIKRGASIITDTNMAKAGINKRVLGKYGGEVLCFMADEDIAKRAKETALQELLHLWRKHQN